MPDPPIPTQSHLPSVPQSYPAAQFNIGQTYIDSIPDDVNIDEISPPVSPVEREDAVSSLQIVDPDADNSGQAPSVTLDQRVCIEKKPSEPKYLSRHQRWLPTVTLLTITCPSFISKRLGHVSRWWQGHRYLNLWWWEAICCIIALGSLLAIVATIRTHEGKPLPQWRYGLTVNAIIAAYTVILKAAAGLVLAEGISHLKWIAVAQPQALSTFAAHDNASRGPLGALQLLWKNQFKPGNLRALPFISSLGALVTVLVLLLDPFSQQIIRTYKCERQTTGGGATVARTNAYWEVRSSVYHIS